MSDSATTSTKTRAALVFWAIAAAFAAALALVHVAAQALLLTFAGRRRSGTAAVPASK